VETQPALVDLLDQYTRLVRVAQCVAQGTYGSSQIPVRVVFVAHQGLGLAIRALARQEIHGLDAVAPVPGHVERTARCVRDTHEELPVVAEDDAVAHAVAHFRE